MSREAEKRVEKLFVYQPAVRMVVIDAWADGDGPDENGYRLLPVVAAQAVVRVPYRGGERVTRYPRTDDDLVEHEPLIWDDDYGICTLDEAACNNTVMVVVPCPWSPEEDEVRLADKIAAARQIAVAKVQLAEDRRKRAAAAKNGTGTPHPTKEPTR